MLSREDIDDLLVGMGFMCMNIAYTHGAMLWYSHENAQNPVDRTPFVRFECPLPKSRSPDPYRLMAHVHNIVIPRTRFETFREAFEYATFRGVFMPSVNFAEIEAYYKLRRILEHVEDESDPEIEDLIEQLEPRVDVARRTQASITPP